MKDLGALSGSREPDPSCTGSGPPGLDPAREEREAVDWLECQTKMTRDWHYKCQEEIINFQRMGDEYAPFQKQWEEREKHYRQKRKILETLCAIVKDRDEWREQHENLVYVRQADLAAVAIAAGSRQGGDGTAPCEASQSGAESASPNPCIATGKTEDSNRHE